MNNDIVDTISKGIDMLAKKLGVAANKIYPILQKQVKVDLIENIIFVVLGIFLIVGASIIVYKIIKAKKEEDSFLYDTFWDCGVTGCGVAIDIVIVLMYIFGICFMFCIGDIIQIMANPQYYIFTEYIKPLIK